MIVVRRLGLLSRYLFRLIRHPLMIAPIEARRQALLPERLHQRRQRRG
jgi:hypothetical protein